MAGKQLIECVPNFSEGRDMNVIRQITDEIEKVEGERWISNETLCEMQGGGEKSLCV